MLLPFMPLGDNIGDTGEETILDPLSQTPNNPKLKLKAKLPILVKRTCLAEEKSFATRVTRGKDIYGG